MADDKAKPAPAEGTSEAEVLSPEAQAAADAGKKKKKKLLLFGAVGLMVVGIAVAVGVVFFMGGKKDAEAQKDDPHTAMPEVTFVEVPEFTLNLLSNTGEDGKGGFLRLKVSVELGSAADVETLSALQPKLRDDWGAFLRQLRPADLQGTAALARVKEGLLRRANQVLAPLVVKGVYLTEMLTQ
jgi:flagellar FliL protein